MKSNVIKAVLLLLCSIFFDGCVLVDFRDPEMPSWTNIYFNGRLLTDPETNIPIDDAIINPKIYTWVNSSYTGQTYSAGWGNPYRPGYCTYSASVGQRGVFVTDSMGCWRGSIYDSPTKLKIEVVYMDKDSVKHSFWTREYKYADESSWQNVTIYASEYE